MWALKKLNIEECHNIFYSMKFGTAKERLPWRKKNWQFKDTWKHLGPCLIIQLKKTVWITSQLLRRFISSVRNMERKKKYFKCLKQTPQTTVISIHLPFFQTIYSIFHHFCQISLIFFKKVSLPVCCANVFWYM